MVGFLLGYEEAPSLMPPCLITTVSYSVGYAHLVSVACIFKVYVKGCLMAEVTVQVPPTAPTSKELKL